MCAELQTICHEHINLAEYDKASSAISLMKQIGVNNLKWLIPTANLIRKEVIIKNNDAEIKALERQLNQLQRERNLILSQIENEKAIKQRSL